MPTVDARTAIAKQTDHLWTWLYIMAINFPDKPEPTERQALLNLLTSFKKLLPTPQMRRKWEEASSGIISLAKFQVARNHKDIFALIYKVHVRFGMHQKSFAETYSHYTKYRTGRLSRADKNALAGWSAIDNARGIAVIRGLLINNIDAYKFYLKEGTKRDISKLSVSQMGMLRLWDEGATWFWRRYFKKEANLQGDAWYRLTDEKRIRQVVEAFTRDYERALHNRPMRLASNLSKYVMGWTRGSNYYERR